MGGDAGSGGGLNGQVGPGVGSADVDVTVGNVGDERGECGAGSVLVGGEPAAVGARPDEEAQAGLFGDAGLVKFGVVVGLVEAVG